MDAKGMSNAWLYWFNSTSNINGMKHEIELIDKLIEMEKQYPYKGEQTYKTMIRKKILLQSKIKLLEEKGSVVNG